MRLRTLILDWIQPIPEAVITWMNCCRGLLESGRVGGGKLLKGEENPLSSTPWASEEFFSDGIRGRFTLGSRAATMKILWVLENPSKGSHWEIEIHFAIDELFSSLGPLHTQGWRPLTMAIGRKGGDRPSSRHTRRWRSKGPKKSSWMKSLHGVLHGGRWIRGLPRYKQLNFGGGRNWLGATAAALMGTTQAGDKNDMALKSRVLPHDALPLVFPWKFRNLGSLCGTKLPVVWYMTIGKVTRCKHLLWKAAGTIVHIGEPQLP